MLRIRGLGPGLALPLTCCLTLGSSLSFPETQLPYLHNDECGLQIPIVSLILKKVREPWLGQSYLSQPLVCLVTYIYWSLKERVQVCQTQGCSCVALGGECGDRVEPSIWVELWSFQPCLIDWVAFLCLLTSSLLSVPASCDSPHGGVRGSRWALNWLSFRGPYPLPLE